MDRPDGRKILRFDGLSGRGLRIALRAMLIKSALRDLLLVSYDMKTILLTGSLRSPPPIRAAPDFPLCRRQNKTPRNALFISGSTLSTGYSAPACGGKVVAPATKGGMHFLARQGGCMVLYKLAPSIILKAAHHGLCPLSGANTTLGTEGQQARWMPYAPLRQTRRPLREYRKAPPRRLVFIER